MFFGNPWINPSCHIYRPLLDIDFNLIALPVIWVEFEVVYFGIDLEPVLQTLLKSVFSPKNTLKCFLDFFLSA